MDKDRLEDRWRDCTPFDAFEPWRQKYREASTSLVREVLGSYVQPKDKILEIGSGLGELAKLVPEYKARIQQTEQSPEVIAEHKARDKDSNIIQANVYALPFPNASFDRVVACSVFDTLEDLESALKEVSRVTTPKGKFIHFLEFQACANTFFHKYVPQGFIPFPYFEYNSIDNKWHHTGFHLVKREDLSQIQKKLVSSSLPLGKIFEIYCMKPEVYYCEMERNEKLKPAERQLSDSVRDCGIKAKIIKMDTEFQRGLESSLISAGYEIIESENKSGVAIVQRNGRHAQNPEYNLFHNDVGQDMSKYDANLAKSLKPGQVKTISTMYVVVAEKGNKEAGELK